MKHTAGREGIWAVLAVLLCLFLCAGCAAVPSDPSRSDVLPAVSSEETASVPGSSGTQQPEESGLSDLDVTHIHSFTRPGPVTPPTCTREGSEVW